MGTMMTHDVARATQRERADVPQPPATPSPPPRGPRSVPRETSRRLVVGLVLAVLLPPVGLAVSVAALVRAHREGRRSKVAVVGVAVAAAIIQVAVGYGALLAVRHLEDAEVTSAVVRSRSTPPRRSPSTAGARWNGPPPRFGSGTAPTLRPATTRTC